MEFSRRLEEQQTTRDRRTADSNLPDNRPNDIQSALHRKQEELYQSDLAVQKHSELITKTGQQMVGTLIYYKLLMP